MNNKEQLSKLLFDAICALGAVMVDTEFAKDTKAMVKANRVRNWLVSLTNEIESSK